MGIREVASGSPDKAALIMVDCGDRRTFGELNRRADQHAQLFRSLGLQPGDGVAFTMANGPELLEVCFGAIRAGLYFTAISTRLTAAETQYIVDDCGARAYLVSAEYGALAREMDSLLDRRIHRFSVGGRLDDYGSLDAAVSTMPAVPLNDETKGQDLLYSSGTTGRPKGIRVPLSGDSPEQLSDNARAVATLYGWDDNAVYLSPAPLYHAAPLRFNIINLMLGGTSVIMRQFDPGSALRSIEEYRCTHSQWVPTMFVRMLKLPQRIRGAHDLSSMKFAIHAAAPCPVAVKRKILKWWGPIVYEYYAGSESNGFCAIGPDDWMTHEGSVGRPLYGAVHIVGDDGRELSAGQTGLVYFSGGTDFEYLNDREKTRLAYNDAGWSTLGDVGHLDEDGYLYLTDRKAYTIISGGVNIYPQEAEDVLIMHPAVADVAVFGVPDDEMGEQVKAVIQLQDPAEAGPKLERTLIDYCHDHLARFKCPRTIDFMEQLPRHETGKLYKRLLRDRYWSGNASRDADGRVPG